MSSSSSPVSGLNGWTWSDLSGAINESIPIGDVQQIGKVILFHDSLVYWHNPNSSFLSIGVYNLTTHVNRDVWSWQGGQMLGSDFLIVNGTTLYFAFAGQGNYPVYNGSIIFTTNLENWTSLLISHTITIESLCYYNGELLIGGYRSEGAGTYAVIETIQNGSEVRLFAGTPAGSDDVTFLAHLNSTMIVGGDAYPQSIFYGNDGIHWVDDYTNADLEPPFQMGWSFNYEVRNESVWMADSGYSTILNERSGLASFNGSVYESFPLPFSFFSIANGTVGGTGAIWNSTLVNFPGKGIVYQYNLDGTLGSQIMTSSINGSVMSLYFSSSDNALYGLFYDMQNNQLHIIEGQPS